MVAGTFFSQLSPVKKSLFIASFVLLCAAVEVLFYLTRHK